MSTPSNASSACRELNASIVNFFDSQNFLSNEELSEMIADIEKQMLSLDKKQLRALNLPLVEFFNYQFITIIYRFQFKLIDIVNAVALAV